MNTPCKQEFLFPFKKVIKISVFPSHTSGEGSPGGVTRDTWGRIRWLLKPTNRLNGPKKQASLRSLYNTVDGNQKSGESPVDMISHCLQGFIHPKRGCLGFLNHQQYLLRT